MRVYFLSFVVFVSLCSIAYAQQTDSSRVDTKFFNENGREVKSKSEADYVRVTRAIDSGDIKYEFVDYYRNGRKRQGTGIEPVLELQNSKFNIGSNTNIGFHGKVIEYYSNGKKKSIRTYDNAIEVGMAYLFYVNGNLKEVRDYHNHRNLDGRYKTVKFIDSFGKHLLDSTSSGIVVSTNGDFSMEIPYINGYRHGLQKQYWHKEKINIEVLYKNGEIVSAKRKGGGFSVKIKANRIEDPGLLGFKSFVWAIMDKMQNNSGSTGNKEEKRRIVIQFDIEENGSITNVNLLRPSSTNSVLINEIVSVIQSIDKWFPVLANGVSAKTRFALPMQL